MKKLNYFVAAMIVGAAISNSGCARKTDDTAKKLEEMQKQLDATKKQLEAANGQAPGAAGGSAQAPGQPAAGGAGQSSAAGYGQPAAPAAPAAPPPPVTHTLAAGTPVVVRTIGPVSTKTSQVGSLFEATLAEPLVVSGYVVAPKGASVEGTVISSDPGGKVKGVASISVGLRSLSTADGRNLPIKTSAVAQDAKKTKGKDAAKIGIATGVGAAIGAIAGGGKGAAIGAGAGAAGGTGLVLATKGEPATIPAETVLTFKLSAPVTVQEQKK